MLKVLIRVVVTALLLAWVVFRVDIQQVGSVIRMADGSWLMVGVVVYFVGMMCAVWRWQILLHALSITQPFLRVTRLFFVSCFFSMFLPSSIGGDVMRMVLLTPSMAKREVAVSSVLLDRLIGLAVIIVGGLCAALALPIVRNDPGVMATLAITATLFILGLAPLFSRPLLSFLLVCLPFGLRSRLHGPVNSVRDSFVSLRQHPKALFGAIGTSILLQIAVCISVYLAGRAFDIQAGLLIYFALIPIGLAVTALPITINGLGVQDNVLLLLFSAVGVSATEVVVLSLYMHVLRNGVGVLGGLLFALPRFSIASKWFAVDAKP